MSVGRGSACSEAAGPTYFRTAAARRAATLSSVKSGKISFVFLVRMWLHGERGDDARWRGSVHDVESGQLFYVADARDVADFIDAKLAERPADDLGSP